MPNKRTSLQSPDPIKEQKLETSSDDMTASDVLVVSGDGPAPDAALPSLVGRVGGGNHPSHPDFDASAVNAPLTPPHSGSERSYADTASPIRTPPVSPGQNRAKFMQKFVPSSACCNLELCRASPGTKIRLFGIVIAVFPASKNPDRRYIQIADLTGSVGITVWNSNVNLFGFDSVGKVVQCDKVVIATHNGKKTLTMARDSTIEFVRDADHALAKWWREILDVPPTPLGNVQNVADNTIINVAGVLGFASEELKMVGNVSKTLTSLHLTDATGNLDVRSWNHSAHPFHIYADRPLLVKRIRVTSFAGTKIGELLDGHGSEFVTEFAGKSQLERYWAE